MRGKACVTRMTGLLIVMALIVASVPLAVTAAPSGQEVQGHTGPRSAAEIYVSRVAQFINVTLQLASSHGIELNASMMEKVNESLTLIAWARANLTVNETLSVQLATRASLTFAPVAEYVWGSLPSDVREEMKIRAMEKIVSSRIAALEKLQQRLVEIQNETGANLSALLAWINQTIGMLEQAREYLNQSNVTAAIIVLRETRGSVAAAAQHAYIRAYKAMRRTATISILVLHLTDHVTRLTNAVNRTLQELNQTAAPENLTGALRALAERNRALLIMAERLADRYPLQNTSDPAYHAIITIVAGLNISQQYLDLAVNASIQGNITWVAANLSAALETLNSTLANLTSIQLPVTIKHRVIEIMREAQRFHKMRDIVLNRTYASISMMLDRKMNMLQKLYEKYQEGKIPAWRLRAIFTIEQQSLITLKSSLPADTPDWLIQKIDNMLSWISDHMP